MIEQRKGILKWLVIALMLSLAVLQVSVQAEADAVSIIVLISKTSEEFSQTLSAFKDDLTSQGINADYEIFPLEGDPRRAAGAIQNIKKRDVHLVFTMGTYATEVAEQANLDVPIIAGMVLRPETIHNQKSATGVYLEHPVNTQLKWLKQFLPGVKKIGVLYNPEENEQRITQAKNEAHKLGLKIIAYKVQSPQEISIALKKLSTDVDVLWGISDAIVLTPQTAKHILLFSFRNRIPFVGLSSAWVRAGAIYSLEWDYPDLGKQCSEMALRILRGEDVNSIPPAAPRKIRYALNMKTAERMKVNISESIIKESSQVY